MSGPEWTPAAYRQRPYQRLNRPPPLPFLERDFWRKLDESQTARRVVILVALGVFAAGLVLAAVLGVS